jgi:hypothetical protein
MAIINLTDIRNYIDIPNNANETDLTHRIREAELLDVKSQIGDELFTDISNNPGDTENASLIELLKPAIVYYSYARHLEGGNIHATAYGVKKKETPNSTSATSKEIKERAGSNRDIAYSYIVAALSYIETNIGDYPLYNGASTFKKPGLKIAQVKRT